MSNTKTSESVEYTITIPHSMYKTPKAWMVERMLMEQKIKVKLDEKLFPEITNVISHDYFDDNIDGAFIPVDKLPKEFQKYAAKVYKIMADLNWHLYPGSPLQQSIMLSVHISKYAEKKGFSSAFEMIEKSQNLDEVIEEMNKQIAGLSKELESQEAPEEFVEIPPDWQGGVGGDDPGRSFIVSPKLIDKVVTLKKEDLLVFEILYVLQEFTKIKGRGKTRKVWDPSSVVKRKQLMQDTVQIFKVNPIEMVMPNFTAKLASRNLVVKDGILTHKTRQKRFVICDNSGSMNNGIKRGWRNAIVKMLCQEVKDGVSTFTFRHYVTHFNDEHIITTAEEAESFYEKIKSHRPYGGGTEIAKVVQSAIDQLSQQEGRAPDLIIIMDGEDDFSANSVDTKNVVVHSFILGALHKEIKKLCDKTGGITVQKIF